MNKCVFIDRDGVLNEETGYYIFETDKFIVVEGAREGLQLLKEKAFKLVVVTNQAGISKGLYTIEQMNQCHQKLLNETGNIIDAIYYSPWHPSVSESLHRKPDTLMFEKAVSKFNIDVKNSWMIGDRETDVEAGKKMGLKTIRIMHVDEPTEADWMVNSLREAIAKVK